jgi:predicted nucleic acid-binding protein
MIYVDTSVMVALLTMEPKTLQVAAWYAGLNEIPTASDWILPEFSSALSIKVRTGQLSEQNAKNARKEFDLLVNGGVRLVAVSREACRKADDLVRAHQDGLRAGDSLHLAIALESGASHMATLDGNLATNARRQGLELIEF